LGKSQLLKEANFGKSKQKKMAGKFQNVARFARKIEK